jgi:alpha-L-rhamnosidase
MQVTRLTCEYADDPLGVDRPQPRLSWQIQSDRRSVVQSAYQILVATSPESLQGDLGDKWDSTRVSSDRSVNVLYGGRPLTSAEICWWKVRVWDERGEASPWSQAARFEMGLLSSNDWRGQWITSPAKASAPLLRREFELPGQVRRARLYMACLGWCELRLNGSKVGDHEMDPAPTWYDNVLPCALGSRVLYVTHDVASLLVTGANAIGAMLGHGWYSSDTDQPPGRKPFADRPAVLVQLNVELEDGHQLSVYTDQTWRTSPGPVTANDMAEGEHYDARLEQPGWDCPGFDQSRWTQAQAVKAPTGRLVAQSVEPIKVTRRLRPVRMLRSGPDSVIFDLGQYISGRTELRVRGSRGHKVLLRHAGRVNFDTGSLDMRNALWWPPHRVTQTESYILKGNGLEVWHPRFTVHGFRYVELVGYPGEPTLEAVEGHVTNSAIEPTGDFECSNDLLNRIHRNIRWTFQGSFQGYPQDAADRAERVGWLGDPGFVAEDFLLSFQSARFWQKWLADLQDAQKSDGALPCVCPPYWHEFAYSDWPCWEVTYAILVWQIYRYCDDPIVLTDHYESLKRQLERFRSLAKDYSLSEPLGDHMEPREDGTSSSRPQRTSGYLCGTAYYYLCASITAQAAEVLGLKDDAQQYRELAGSIRRAFHQRFFDAGKRHYDTGSQCANALALAMDLVPAEYRGAVLDNLVSDIDKRGGRLSTGIIGTDALTRALPACGRADTMYRIATQTDFPSWGYGVLHGQTTIAEDFECSHRYSVSMKMFGSVEKFFYRDLAGIQLVGPGYRHFDIRPQVVGDLIYARASLATVRGLIAVEWRREQQGLHLEVTVPVNTTATVHLPKLGHERVVVTESGRPIAGTSREWQDTAGITALAHNGSDVILRVGSGIYRFRLLPDQ